MTQPPQQPPPKGPPPADGPRPPETPPESGKPEPSDKPDKLLVPPPRRLWLIVMLAFAVTIGLYLSSSDENAGPEIDYTAFYSHAEKGEVEKVRLEGRRLEGVFRTEQTIGERKLKAFRTRLPQLEDEDLLPMLRKQGVVVQVREETGGLTSVISLMLPWLLLGGFGWWLLNKNRSVGGTPPFGPMMTSPAKRFEVQEKVLVTFDDVAGAANAKRDLMEIVEFLKEPERFEHMGGKLPKGVLLAGAPGTGKTLLARAVAGEAGVPFFSITASEFIELFVGVGAARVRSLFQAAKKAAPAIIFIDEIDAVGRSRGTGLGGGHDEREQTLNQLLAEMDGFSGRDQVVVMAATNRPDVLDPALLRPGRFDRRVVVELPECAAREAILEVHARGRPVGPDVSLAELAKATPGYSGADLANLVNEAALHAIRRKGGLITAEDFAEALDKIQLGDPRELHLSPAEVERIAVHEAGHALVAQLVDKNTPLRRVSIIPRGMALGVTQQSTLGDKHLHTRSELTAKLRLLLGGYAAEKLVLGEVSSGAESDLQRASDLAHRMVAQMGMSDLLGPIHLETRSEHPFLGARLATDGGASDASLHEAEQEVRRVLAEAFDDATEVLERNRATLDLLVAALLEHETLDADQLQALLTGPGPTPSGERMTTGSSASA